MNTLKYIQEKFQLDLDQKLPIRLSIDKSKGLSTLFSELGFKVGAEIGVAKGRFSKWLCIKMRKNKLKLFLVDPYLIYDKYIEAVYKTTKELEDYTYEEAKKRLAKFNCEFIRKKSMDAVKDFNDNSLDFVFIYGNHTFEYVINDIAEWSKKVKPGGIISGHDYYRSIELKKLEYIENLTRTERIKIIQVKDAVDGWTLANQINPWFVTKDLCWLWVKP